MSARMIKPDGSQDFGGRLKQLREERGVALREIAESTKISVSALEALERNDVSRLPGGIFVRGIIRAYAAKIGADPERTVAEFITRFPVDSNQSTAGSRSSDDYLQQVARRRGGRRAVIAVVILVPIAAFLAWSFFAFT